MIDIALDLETSQIAKMKSGEGEIHGLFLYSEHPSFEPVAYRWDNDTAEYLRNLVGDDEIRFVIQNAAFDVWVLRKYAGINIPPGRYVDTMVASHCINPQQESHSLEFYGELVDDPKLDYKQAMRDAGLWDGHKDDPSVYDIPWNPVMEEYGMQDVKLTYQWWQEQKVHLEADARLAESFWGVHMPFVETVISMQSGLHVDVMQCFNTATELLRVIEEALADFSIKYPQVPKLQWKAEKKTFVPAMRHGKVVMQPPNLQSPNDVVSLLLTHGWEPDEFKRDTGRPVTSQAVLRRLIATPETPPQLRDVASHVQNIRSLIGIQQQLMQILELVDKPSGMLYGNWHQTGTVTTRLSSSSPNCQNMSTRHPVWGSRMRSCFTPPKGYAMIMGDLSQIELAILAWYLEVLCGDSEMANANRAGKDIHDANTERWYGVNKESPDWKYKRGNAKNGIFAGNYGAQARRLSLTLNIPLSDAREILDTVSRCTEVDQLKEIVWGVMRQAREVEAVRVPRTYRKTKTGFLYDVLNTRLFYPDINSKDEYLRGKAERQAFNALMQGGCASILRKLCNESLPYVQECGGWIAATVHDEMLSYALTAKADYALEQLNRVWNSMVLSSEQGGVYVRAEFKIVESWADK